MSLRRILASSCVAALLASAQTGCGDPLAYGTWQGETLHTIHGWVHLAVSPEEFEALDGADGGALRTALFWAPTRGSNASLENAVEQDVSATGSFPARFELAIHTPPPDELLRPDPQSGSQFAVALLVAYRDINGNERWDRASERLVGGTTDRFILYAPDGIANAAFGTLDAGFHRIRPANACDGATQSIAYEVDPAESVTLIVGRGFPADVALTFNCDATGIVWSGACPPLPTVRDRCGPDLEGTVNNDVDPMCTSCRPLLAPIDASDETCQRWLQSCVLNFPGHECQREFEVCTGVADAPRPRDPDACDATCQCQRNYEQCLDANPDAPAECRARLDACLGATSQ